MENKMEQVAKLLGVELDEEFRIEHLNTKYKLSKNGLKYWSGSPKKWNGSGLLEDLIIGTLKIIKISKPILDDIEKEYLSAVIKPFRNRVICIIKNKCLPDEYLRIHLKHYTGKDANEIIYLPCFKNGLMYKGMEINKEYTLEELGL